MPAIYLTKRFERWFAQVADLHAKRRIQARIDRAEDGHLGDYKPVGEKVFEMRIHHGPGYRVYFTLHGLEIVVLLAGGDKSTQTADIAMAIKEAKLLGDWR